MRPKIGGLLKGTFSQVPVLLVDPGNEVFVRFALRSRNQCEAYVVRADL